MEVTKDLETLRFAILPRTSRGEEWRRALGRGVRTLAEAVAALHGPRRLSLEGAELSGAATTPIEVVERFAPLSGAEEVGAALLRQAARSVWREVGHGVGDAVCLASALVLSCLEAVESGAPIPALHATLESTRDLLLSGVDEVARPASPEELQDLLFQGLEPRYDSLPEGTDHVFLVPGRLPGAEVHRFRGLYVSVCPQAKWGLPVSGSWEGPHRILNLSAPVRTSEELRRLFRELASFQEPLLILASRLSPRVATEAILAARDGQLPGHLLWIPAEDEEGIGDLEPPLPAFAHQGMPEPVEDLERAHHLLPESLPLAQRILWLDEGALLDVDLPGGHCFAAFSLGEDVRKGPGLGRTLRLVKEVRRQGMVPGGGASYLALGRTTGAQGSSSLPILRCLEEPMRSLVRNEKMDEETVLDRVHSLPPGAGYDILQRRFFLSSEEGPAMPAAAAQAVLVVAFEAALTALERIRRGEVEDAQGA